MSIDKLVPIGVVVELISARLGTGVGGIFSLPTRACVIGWQTSFDEDPDAVSITLEVSIDETVWKVLDTSTVVGGELRFITTFISARFIRANVGTNTGNKLVTVLLLIKAT